MRWGIEVEFRGLKQTLDRAKLRCRNGRRLLAELNWSIMAMAVAELFALKEQLSSQHREIKSKELQGRPPAAQLGSDHARHSIMPDEPPRNSAKRARPAYATASRRHRQLSPPIDKARPLPPAKPRQKANGRSQNHHTSPTGQEAPRCDHIQTRCLKSFTALPFGGSEECKGRRRLCPTGSRRWQEDRRHPSGAKAPRRQGAGKSRRFLIASLPHAATVVRSVGTSR